MNDDTTDGMSVPDAIEETLGQFILELEDSVDRQLILEQWCKKHPELEGRFRDLAHDQHLFNEARIAGPPPLERLGEFRIVRLASHGGMGEVYEAEQESLGRRVAVKIIKRDQVSDSLRERFDREQKVLASLHHTHIVPIHSAGEEGGMRYFAMPFIEGATLDNAVKQIRRLASDSSLRPGTPPIAHLARDLSPPSRRANDEAPSDVPPPTAAFESSLEEEDEKDSLWPLRLSGEYIRSAAHTMIDVAEAIHSAHEAGVLHRDVKPANIMVDVAGHAWVIDFGLSATFRPASPPGGSESVPPAATTPGLGTAHYMAPEQLDGQPDVKSDVYGLGATLYELLTLRRPFDSDDDDAKTLTRRIKNESIPRPSVFVSNMSRDLEAVCLKALSRDPRRRYPTARDFAEDLRRWLDGMSVLARRTRPVRRVWLWSKRNPGWAAAIVMTALSFTAASLAVAMDKARQAREAQAREAREALQRSRLVDRTNGWYETTELHIRKAAAVAFDDEWLPSQTAASLSGLDAHEDERFKRAFDDIGAAHIAFNSAGSRLLLGHCVRADRLLVPAQVWGMESGTIADSSGSHDGPVAFDESDRPTQLTYDTSEQCLVLTNLLTHTDKLRIHPPNDSQFVLGSGYIDGLGGVALATNASMVCGTVSYADGSTEIVVWQTNPLQQRYRFRCESGPTAIAFSPDSSFVAASTEEAIHIWSLDSGRQIAELRNTTDDRIHCLAFSRDRLTRAGDASNWLLAAGDAGGLVTIWDVRKEMPRAFCVGSHYDVYCVEFSPDSMILASGGRKETRVWDVATGRLLLQLQTGDFMASLALSPSGEQLAVGCLGVFEPPSVHLWDLEFGRGIETMYGLSSQVSKVCFSRDGQRLAGLSQNWKLAIWDVPNRKLLHILDLPKGRSADNSAIAFTPDSRQVFFSAGANASLWDVREGKLLRRWSLPQGLMDSAGFTEDKKLLLLRTEESGTDGFLRYKIRNLFAQSIEEETYTIKASFGRVFGAMAAVDGSRFLVAGEDRTNGRFLIQVVDERGEVHSGIPNAPEKTIDQQIFMNPSGSAISFVPDNTQSKPILFDLESQRRLELLPYMPQCMSPNGKFWARRAVSTGGFGLALYRVGESRPVVTLNIDDPIDCVKPDFSPDSRFLAWGNNDGTVSICELAELRRRLDDLGLGW